MLPTVILQDGRTGEFLHYAKPRALWQTHRVEEVRPLLAAVAAGVARGDGHAAGFVAYDAAPAFDSALVVRGGDPLPLLWFGLFDPPARRPLPLPIAPCQIGEWTATETAEQFGRHIAAIHAAIAAGQTYQVNHTYRLRAPLAGDAYAFFYQLAQAQGGRYAAWIDGGDWAVCSASPELFFALEDGVLTSRPMKGTAPRGLTHADDLANMEALRLSEKNRAENVMIVDMVRNDMGRIAPAGAVRVPALFEVTRYPTLHQMTSTVTAETTAELPAVFDALFPCASITGAPKVRTMQIIRDLESTPRGLYTGAIGRIEPGGRAHFSVAIRTAVIDRRRGTAVYGVGSGIVWDSDAAEEYRETQLKARILSTCAAAETPAVLEALLWEPEAGYLLADRHRERARATADYFGLPFDAVAWERALAEAAVGLQTPTKVRLIGDRAGRFTATAELLRPMPWPVALWLPPHPIDRRDPRLYHKTTARAPYAAALAGAQAAGCADALLWNDRGEITETTTANVALWRNGRWATPPVHAGLLAGTFRAELLDRGVLHEEPITVDEARAAPQIWLLNSVRRWRPAVVSCGDRAISPE